MTRKYILHCGSLFLCLANPAIGTSMTLDERKPVPADAEEANAVEPEPVPRVRLSSVDMIPIYSIGADVNALNELGAFFEKRIAKEERENFIFFDFAEGASDLGPLPEVANFGFNGFLTRPEISYYGDLVCPLHKGLADEIKKDSDTKKRAEGVYENDGMTVVFTDTSYGLSYGENLEYSSEDATRLRRLMRETAETSMKHICFIKSEPYKIGRSVLKPQLNAVRSMLHTQAQRRDAEPELNYLARATYQRTLVSLLDVFFNETKSIKYALDFDSNSPSVTASITVDAVTGTSLDKYVSRISSQRSRLLSYLHPDQRGFVSASIPLSEDLANNMPRIMGLGASAIAGEDATEPLAGIEHALRQIQDERSIECLVQALPGSNDTLSFIIIVPLQDAASLNKPLIQLVSGVNNGTQEASIDLGRVGEWRAHNLNLGFESDSGDRHSFVVITDDCIGLCLASKSDMPVVQAVLERDFEESAAAKRFQRSALAIATTHSSFRAFGEQAFGNSVPKLKVPDDKSPLPDGRIELSLQTAPHQLTITARFDNDGIDDGIWLFSSTLEMLLELVEELYE